MSPARHVGTDTGVWGVCASRLTNMVRECGGGRMGDCCLVHALQVANGRWVVYFVRSWEGCVGGWLQHQHQHQIPSQEWILVPSHYTVRSPPSLSFLNSMTFLLYTFHPHDTTPIFIHLFILFLHNWLTKLKIYNLIPYIARITFFLLSKPNFINHKVVSYGHPKFTNSVDKMILKTIVNHSH